MSNRIANLGNDPAVDYEGASLVPFPKYYVYGNTNVFVIGSIGAAGNTGLKGYPVTIKDSGYPAAQAVHPGILFDSQQSPRK